MVVHQPAGFEPRGQVEEKIQASKPDPRPYGLPSARWLTEFGNQPARSWFGRGGDSLHEFRRVSLLEAIEEKVCHHQVIFARRERERHGVSLMIGDLIRSGALAGD